MHLAASVGETALMECEGTRDCIEGNTVRAGSIDGEAQGFARWRKS